MSHLEVLKVVDVIAIVRLVRECCELGDDDMAWRQHMLASLCSLFRARLAAHVPHYVRKSDRRFTWLAPVRYEADNPVVRTWNDYHYARGNVGDDPHILLKNGSGGYAVAQKRIASDREWCKSAASSGAEQLIQMPDRIFSQFCSPKLPFASGIYLARNTGSKPFSAADAQRLHLFHTELGHVWETPPLSPDESALSSLSHRQQQMLLLLSEGRGEQEIASQLELSRHTVHGYIRTLYRRFGVSSQTALLARLLPRRTFRPRLTA